MHEIHGGGLYASDAVDWMGLVPRPLLQTSTITSTCSYEITNVASVGAYVDLIDMRSFDTPVHRKRRTTVRIFPLAQSRQIIEFSKFVQRQHPARLGR